tara:strand:+ start:153 stop:1214 length:1062 start_codon:yes stop_codon:yes gene_type:complete
MCLGFKAFQTYQLVSADEIMKKKIRLSVLDQSPLRPDTTATSALRETIELAKIAEELGYHRYWLAEHHGSDGLASASPEVLITRIASETNTIRVGSGGVMLSHYSPYKVAENFRTLEAMFPGRIDLGIGRAPGSDHPTTRALAYGGGLKAEHFPTMVSDLHGFLTDSLPKEHPFEAVKVRPYTPSSPPIWLLGSSDYSAAYAAHFGFSFSFAHFITPYGGEAVTRAYQDQFQCKGSLEEPKINMGVFVICAETDAEADKLMSTRDLFRLRADRGHLAPIPTIEESLSYPYTDAEREYVLQSRAKTIYGAPKTVKKKIGELSDLYKNDEFLVLTACPDFESRRRSYELLAEAFA